MHAENIPLVKTDSDQHQEAATVPPEQIGGDDQDVSFNVQQGQQEVPEQHDHEDSQPFVLQIFHQLDPMVR